MTGVLLHELAKPYEKKNPEILPGYTVRVHERVREGDKERVQIFEGLVIGVHKGHNPADASFTVRRIASGIGVEKIFPLYSGMVQRIEVKKIAKVRRAKLSFLRGRRGKSARMSERFTSSDEFAVAVQKEVDIKNEIVEQKQEAPAVEAKPEKVEKKAA